MRSLEAGIALRKTEQALIGAIIADPGRLVECSDIAPHHFFKEVHGDLWSMLATMFSGFCQPSLPLKNWLVHGTPISTESGCILSRSK